MRHIILIVAVFTLLLMQACSDIEGKKLQGTWKCDTNATTQNIITETKLPASTVDPIFYDMSFSIDTYQKIITANIAGVSETFTYAIVSEKDNSYIINIDNQPNKITLIKNNSGQMILHLTSPNSLLLPDIYFTKAQ